VRSLLALSEGDSSTSLLRALRFDFTFIFALLADPWGPGPSFAGDRPLLACAWAFALDLTTRVEDRRPKLVDDADADADPC